MILRAASIFTLRPLIALLVLLLCFGGFLFEWVYQNDTAQEWTRIHEVEKLNRVPPPGSVDKAIVAAKMPNEDVSWLHKLRKDGWTPYIYSATQPPEPGYSLHPRTLRGRESASYLTFIVANYASLPNITVFAHSSQVSWHNEDLPEGADTGALLGRLRLDSVRRLGYLNLRCAHEPGCPISVNPWEPSEVDVKKGDIRAHFVDVYLHLFALQRREDVPAHVGGVCCGQFAVSRERILARPRADYERMLEWAAEGSRGVTDEFGVGWVFEKVWHVVFGMPAQYCPHPDECKCNIYGECRTDMDAGWPSNDAT